jgi:hypothetical protein
MALLLLYDHQTRREIGWRDAAEQERYVVYEMLRDGDLFTMHGKRYRLKGVAYNPTTAEIIVQGTFVSYESGYVDCE